MTPWLNPKRLYACLLGGLLLTISPQVSAQDAQERLVARTLFDEGRTLIAENKIKEACEKFAESLRVDRKGGTLLNLAVCHERDGKTASAWLEFKDALALSQREGRSSRVSFAEQRIASLEPILSRMTIHVPEEARLVGIEIRLDNVPIGRGAWDTPVPVDPGAYLIRAWAPGFVPWQEEVSVAAQAGLTQVRIPLLVPEPSPTPSSGQKQSTQQARERSTLRWGAFLRTDIDGKFRGAVPVAGASLALSSHFDLSSGALLGSYQGVWTGATVYPFLGKLSPVAQAGLPIFFDHGPRLGVQAGIGMAWSPFQHVSLYLLSSTVHFFSAPTNIDATTFVPSVGLTGWL